MKSPARERTLGIYLYCFGAINVITSFGVPLLLGDLMWEPRNLPVELMVGAVYFALGFVMFLAAGNPAEHKALVDFVVLSSLLHALVMAFFAEKAVQLAVDVGYMAAMGAIPLVAYPWGLRNFMRY